MTAVAEVRYVALKALPVEIEGERQVLAPGEEIPQELVGSWVGHAMEAGKVAPITVLSDEEFVLEAKLRGYKLVPLKTAKAA